MNPSKIKNTTYKTEYPILQALILLVTNNKIKLMANKPKYRQPKTMVLKVSKIVPSVDYVIETKKATVEARPIL